MIGHFYPVALFSGRDCEIGRTECGEWYGVSRKEPMFHVIGTSRMDVILKAIDEFATYAKENVKRHEMALDDHETVR